MTPEEKVMWHYLRGRNLGGFKFRRQQIIGGFIADFYCHELIFRTVLLVSVPMEVYYSVSIICGRLSALLLLGISYGFLRWYWRTKGETQKERR